MSATDTSKETHIMLTVV